MFSTWRAVVLLEDQRQQEIYRRILELGGARVERWTVQHLVDLPQEQLANITHIISHPNLIRNLTFAQFMNDNKNVPVLAYIYVGDFLIKKPHPLPDNYDIRSPPIIRLLGSEATKDAVLQ